MGIKKKRGVLSLFFVFLWVFLFSVGMYIVFLFLQGFNFFDLRVSQKGYASFSSASPLYLQGNYIENSGRYAQYESGVYDLCVNEFGKKERCYDFVDVRNNGEISQKISSVFLVPDGEKDWSVALSEKNDLIAFSSDDGAFLWYDSFLRQAFYVESGEDGLASVFPKFLVTSVMYDEDLHRFVMRGAGKDEVSFVKISPRSVLFSERKYDFREYFFSVFLSGNGIFSGFETDLKGVFLQKNKKTYALPDGRFVLFFKKSVYLFTSERSVFQFLSSKDEEFDGVCKPEEKKCFYMKDGIFRFIQL